MTTVILFTDFPTLIAPRRKFEFRGVLFDFSSLMTYRMQYQILFGGVINQTYLFSLRKETMNDFSFLSIDINIKKRREEFHSQVENSMSLLKILSLCLIIHQLKGDIILSTRASWNQTGITIIESSNIAKTYSWIVIQSLMRDINKNHSNK